MRKVLCLAVSKKWFDLIASGEKREEYREIKPYWLKRLCDKSTGGFSYLYSRNGKYVNVTLGNNFKSQYTHVRFVNGYGAKRPHLQFKIDSIAIGKPQRGLCPDEFLDKDYFVIKFK
jgi:hypothetical protein